MINTNPATLRSGTVWFKIQTDFPLTNTGNTDLYDMSDLSYDFDLKSAESAINSFGVIAGSMSIKVADDASTGKSVYDMLSGSLPFQTSGMNATMFFLKHGETTPNTFPFQVKSTGIQYDAKSAQTSIELLPPVQSSNTVNVFLDTIPYGNRTILNQQSVTVDTVFNGYFMGDVIEAFIGEIDSNPGNSNVYLSGYNAVGSTFPSPGFGRTVDYSPGGFVPRLGNVVFGFADLRDVLPSTGEDSIRSKIVSASAMEGAIFGSAFSINFYSNRLTNRANVSLSNNDVTEIKSVRGSGKVNAINVTITPTTTGLVYESTFVTTGAEVAGSPLGDQFIGLNLVAHGPQFSVGILDYDATNSPPEYINCIDAQLNTLVVSNVQGLATAGASVYSSAFDASLIVPTRIETTVLGVDKVKPHETIKFDTTAPARYQGTHYRPSSLKYNFKADTVTISAYKIP
jgi:hypothetical protein